MEFGFYEVAGLSVFVLMMLAAGLLYLIDKFERIDLTLPYGRTIPYMLAVIGAGIFFLATEGVMGLFKGIATGVFLGFVMEIIKSLKKNP